jgi:hypothetical protein
LAIEEKVARAREGAVGITGKQPEEREARNLTGDPKPWGLGFRAAACASACEDRGAGGMEEDTGAEHRWQMRPAASREPLVVATASQALGGGMRRSVR